MRRGTLITLVVLFAVLLITAVIQYLAGHKDVRYPGPQHGTPYPSLTPRSPSPSG